MNKLHWSVDSLVYRDGTFFGYGWVYHEDAEVLELNLVLNTEDGRTGNVNAILGQTREDVAGSFGQSQSALHSGYLVYGSSSDITGEFARLSFAGTLANGQDFEFDIPDGKVRNLDNGIARESVAVANKLSGSLKRGVFLIRSKQFSTLLDKTKGMLVKALNSKRTDSTEPQRILKPREKEYVILLIDHDMGGGANQYSEKLIREKIDEGATVITFSYRVDKLSFLLKLQNKRIKKEFLFPGYDSLLDLAAGIEFKEIIYNSGVSFARPEQIPQLIVELKRKYGSRVTLLVHDFFMVCPSHCLLDGGGSFCQIPDMLQCTKCLATNRQGFATLFKQADIAEWRSEWGNAIAAADEVQTFSNDSLQHLAKAYPSIDISRAVVKPHAVGHFRGRRLKRPYMSAPRIGVVGSIGYHKGANIIKSLAREIKEQNANVLIDIIGTIETRCDESVVRQTGAYQNDMLPDLIEKAGVNIMLFPSVWPETFSYVVQELMELDLPIACFDLGAPAERVREYPKGLILTNTDPATVLDELINFHDRIYRLN